MPSPDREHSRSPAVPGLLVLSLLCHDRLLGDRGVSAAWSCVPRGTHRRVWQRCESTEKVSVGSHLTRSPPVECNSDLQITHLRAELGLPDGSSGSKSGRGAVEIQKTEFQQFTLLMLLPRIETRPHGSAGRVCHNRGRPNGHSSQGLSNCHRAAPGNHPLTGRWDSDWESQHSDRCRTDLQPTPTHCLPCPVRRTNSRRPNRSRPAQSSRIHRRA